VNLNDVIKLDLVGSYKQAAEQRNVFFYQCTNASFEMVDLVQAFIDTFIDGGFLGLFTQDMTFTRLSAVNLFNPDEVYEVGLAWQGQNSVQPEALPPYCTYSVRLAHDKPSEIRKGAKRFSGVPEGQVSDGVFDDVAYPIGDSIMGAVLSVDLLDPIGGILSLARPVVVKRIAEIIDGVTRYRLPTNFAETVVGIVIDAILAKAVGTQTSRKFGYGV